MWNNLNSMKNERKIEINGKTHFINQCGYCPMYRKSERYEGMGSCDITGIVMIKEFDSQPDDKCPLEKRYSF